jgi:hypothetical protein
MNGRHPQKQRTPECLVYCTSSKQQWCSQLSNDKKHILYNIRRKWIGLRIMSTETPLGQESKLRMQRPHIGRCRKLLGQRKAMDWWQQSVNKPFTRWSVLWTKSVRYPTIWWWVRWGQGGWLKDLAMPAPWRWQTQQSDGYNLQHGAAMDSECSEDAPKPLQIGSTGIRGCKRVHPWQWEVQHSQLRSSGSLSTANGGWCNLTSVFKLWRAHAVPSHCPMNLANTPAAYTASKLSPQAMLWEGAVDPDNSQSMAMCRTQLVTLSDSEAS